MVEEVFLFENTCLINNSIYFPYSHEKRLKELERDGAQASRVPSHAGQVDFEGLQNFHDYTKRAKLCY